MRIISRFDAEKIGALSWAKFLDDYRIGLSLQDRYSTIHGTVHFDAPPLLDSRSLFDFPLEKDSWGLGYSEQAITIPMNVFGLMNTRSKFARAGLDMMSSSSYIAPGFGLSDPTQVVFEITARTRMQLSALRGVPVVSLVLFEFPVFSESTREIIDYTDRFPFRG